MEVLTFGELDTDSWSQSHRCVFDVAAGGLFDGMLLHMVVDLDGTEQNTINTLVSETTWRTTYVRLLDKPVELQPGTQIVMYCTNHYDRLSRYFVRVTIIEPEQRQSRGVAHSTGSGNSMDETSDTYVETQAPLEREVSQFSWEGSG